MNVALYGEVKRWAMTERGRGDLARTAERMQVGPSALAWDGQALRIGISEWTAPIPGRVIGDVVVRPTWLSNTAFPLDDPARHWWRPIAPMADIEVTMQAPRLHWRGKGYWDCNWGAEPLERGFTGWTWSRVHDGDEAVVHYDVEPKGGEAHTLSLRFTRDGVAPTATPPLQRLETTGWGIARTARWHGPPDRVDTLEDTPFYARTALVGAQDGRPLHAVHESLSLRRFRSPIVRAMLPFRMPRLAKRGG